MLLMPEEKGGQTFYKSGSKVARNAHCMMRIMLKGRFLDTAFIVRHKIVWMLGY